MIHPRVGRPTAVKYRNGNFVGPDGKPLITNRSSSPSPTTEYTRNELFSSENSGVLNNAPKLPRKGSFLGKNNNDPATFSLSLLKSKQRLSHTLSNAEIGFLEVYNKRDSILAKEIKTQSETQFLRKFEAWESLLTRSQSGETLDKQELNLITDFIKIK